MNITAGARVTVSVVLDGLGSWGPECTVQQVHEQAAVAAVNRIRKIMGSEQAKVELVKVEAVIAIPLP